MEITAIGIMHQHVNQAEFQLLGNHPVVRQAELRHRHVPHHQAVHPGQWDHLHPDQWDHPAQREVEVEVEEEGGNLP